MSTAETLKTRRAIPERDDRIGKSARHGRHAGRPRLAAAHARRTARACWRNFPRSASQRKFSPSARARFLRPACVATRRQLARVFIKRHHRSVRDREGLLEEHRFLAHLLTHGAPVPRVLASAAGETAIESGEWTYEVHETPAGIDLYEDAISWTPFRSAAHAHSAGQALARLHLAAQDFTAPPRKPRPLVASFTIFAAQDPAAEMERYLAARPSLANHAAVRACAEQALESARAVSCRTCAAPACARTALDPQRSARLQSLLERCRTDPMSRARHGHHRLRPRRPHQRRPRHRPRHRAQHRGVARARERSRRTLTTCPSISIISKRSSTATNPSARSLLKKLPRSRP